MFYFIFLGLFIILDHIVFVFSFIVFGKFGVDDCYLFFLFSFFVCLFVVFVCDDLNDMVWKLIFESFKLVGNECVSF